MSRVGLYLGISIFCMTESQAMEGVQQQGEILKGQAENAMNQAVKGLQEYASSGTKHADECVKACHGYYQIHKNLSGFSYHNTFSNNLLSIVGTLGNYFGKKGIAGAKREYCERAIASLEKCYEADYTSYRVCKYVAQWTSSWITSDPKVLDAFASCKDKCYEDVTNFCKDSLN